MSRLDHCRALITGASSGIGRQLAMQLAGRADLLVLVARREERLEELREKLARENPNLRVEIRTIDLADATAREDLLAWLNEEKFEIDFLINNAGFGDLGDFATAEADKLVRVTEVNMVAPTQLTRALLPSMIARGHGAILNVSSTACFLPLPNFAVYAATKSYVTSFSEALRSELRNSGVVVTALCPGPVRTEFNSVADRQGRTSDIGPAFVHVPVEKVAAAALRGIERDRPIVIPGAMMKFSMALVRLTPMAVLRLTSRLSAKRV